MSDDILKILENCSSITVENTSYALEAASFFADIVYPRVLQRLNDVKGEEYFHVSCDYDGFDITVSNDKNKVKTIKTENLELFNEHLTNLDVEIKVEWQESGNDIFDVDGCILTVDDEELHAAGLVYVVARLPSDLIVAKKTIKALHQEIISVLVHEFRHATQKYIWGWTLDEASSLKDHMSALSEIDARVEEICCYSSKAVSELSKEEFDSLALKYMKKYLLRNAKELQIDEFNNLCEALLKTHNDHFVKRSKVSEFTEPQ